jgi:hypothetical protein
VSRRSELTIVFVLVIIINIACGESRAAAPSDPYPRMPAIDQYLMEKNAEIRLARSAAPDSISRDKPGSGTAGYETAVESKNGFVCMVERGWMGTFNWPGNVPGRQRRRSGQTGEFIFLIEHTQARLR